MTAFLTTRRRALAALAALAALPAAAPLQAQPAPWPTKPIRLVVGYAAGGATDVLARLVAAAIGTQLGQPVIVDNRPGANSNIGAEVVARAPADGYTLYVFTSANTTNASLYERLGYDVQKDFEPIGMIAKIPNILVVNPSLPIKTLADYVSYAKQSPQGISFASAGNGSSIHLSAELFKMQSGISMLHVPYKGSGPAVADLIGGQVQSMFDNAPSALPQVKAGRLRAIAITSAHRSPLLPDVPTVAESGYPGFEVQAWFSLAAPAKTPPAVIARLNAVLNQALATAEMKQRLQELGATSEAVTPEQLRATVDTEIKRWREVVKQSGAKISG